MPNKQSNTFSKYLFNYLYILIKRYIFVWILFALDLLNLFEIFTSKIEFNITFFQYLIVLLLLVINVKIIIKKEYLVFSRYKEIVSDIHSWHINRILLTRNEKFIISASGDRSIIVWDLIENKIEYKLIHDSWVGNMVLANEDRLLFSVSGKGVLYKWNLENGEQIQSTSAHTKAIRGIDISTNNDYVVTCSEDGYINKWDSRNLVLLKHKYICSKEVKKIKLNNKNTVFATGDATGSVCFYDPQSFELISTIYQKSNSVIRSLAFSSDDLKLVFCDSNGYIYVLNIVDNTIIHKKIHEGQAIYCDFLPNSSSIISSGQDNLIYLLNSTLEEVACFSGHHDAVTSLAFSTKNHTLFSAGRDKRLLSWNLK